MTEQPRLPSDVVEARLNHLIDRARRNRLLPEEADRFTTELRDLVRRLEDTEDDRDRAQRTATHRLAVLGKRREQIRALEQRVDDLDALLTEAQEHDERTCEAVAGRDVAEARIDRIRDAARLHRQTLISTSDLYAVIEALDPPQ